MTGEPVRIGPYRLDQELGAGGMGRVFRATVERAVATAGLAAGTVVAVKVVHEHLLVAPHFFERFRREAQIGKSVRHENVVATYDADAAHEGGLRKYFLVMEHVEGQTLRSLLAELGVVPEELCRHIGRETAKGLAAIHAAGAVHRDMKPENVLVTRSHVVKVMDLGVAQLSGEALRLSQSGSFVGSVAYGAPEQFRDSASVDARADLHALGLILYELSTAKHPYEGGDFRNVMHRVLEEEPKRCSELNPQLSPFFEELVHTLLAKDRDARIASAAEVAQILAQGEASAWWHERANAIRTTTKRPLRRIQVPRETAVYGREPELAKLRGLYDLAREGHGQAILVEGEAGIGKSRIVDEFVARLAQSGAEVNFLCGGYPLGGAATASGAFSAALRAHLGDEGIEAALAEMLVQTPILVPAFASLLRGETTPTGAEPLARDSLQTVFVQAVRSLAAERPTVLLIDDLHFAPDEGRALFAALALAVPGHRVLFIGTSRPGQGGAWIADLERTGMSRMALARLGAKDLVHLLADTLRSDRLADEIVGRVALKSDGNPFFVFEILRGLRDGGFVTQTPDGTWVGTRVIDEIRIPSSVLEMVQARVSHLAPEERDLLDVAACAGFEFDPLLVGEVVGSPRIPLLKRLAQIERAHRLVRSVGARYVFDHHQVQEALYGSVPELLRREYHAAIGAALEQGRGAAAGDPRDLDAKLCVELAEHFLAGGLGARAKRYLDPALTALEKGYANDEAARLAERALAAEGLYEGAERCGLLLRRAERLDLLGRREQERAALDEAVALADAAGDAALRGRARRLLGMHLWNVAAPAEAEAVLSSALELARAAGDAKLEIDAATSLASVFWMRGGFEEARVRYERCIVLARAAGDLRAEATATNGLSNVMHDTGVHADSVLLRERHLALSRKIGDRRGEAIATGNLANSLLALGRQDEARTRYQRCSAIAREIGFRRGEAISLSNIGQLHVHVGALAQARVALEECLALARAIGGRRDEASALHNLGALARAEGDDAAAEKLFGQALALRRQIAHQDGTADTLLELGSLMAQIGRLAEARAYFDEGLALGRKLEVPNKIVGGTCQLASLAARTAPGTAEAAELAAAAAETFRRHDARLAPAVRMEARYLLWQATGDRDHLAEAKRLLEFLAANAPEDCKRSIVEDVPLHREIAAAGG